MMSKTDGGRERHIKRCRRRAALERVRYTLYWLIPLLLFFMIGSGLAYFLSVKTSWQNFTWTLAQDILYANGEDSMKATFGGEDVRVLYDNRQLVYKMIVNADADGAIILKGGSDTIYFDFGNGHSMDIIKVDENRCFIKYRGEKNYNFKIGIQGAFSHFKLITSTDGGNFKNTPWEQKLEE